MCEGYSGEPILFWISEINFLNWLRRNQVKDGKRLSVREREREPPENGEFGWSVDLHDVKPRLHYNRCN